MVRESTGAFGDPSALLTVAQLTAQIKQALEGTFHSVCVLGEISDIARPQSGHIYLTLKDAESQIRGVIWRSVATWLRFDLDDGLQVICRGDVEVYAPRGSYQLVIRQIEPRGAGALQLALARLQKKLAAEGLFDAARKRPLPRFPRRIALVTSPTGAAVRDFLEVVRQRAYGVHVLVVPTRVQGDGAASEIARAIETVNRMRPPVDVMVVTRGGGSVEDLWCFNEEVVVRAIHASATPVVSAVGHEIDVTLSDLVADVRALTPTEAAQRVVPSVESVASELAGLRRRLRAALAARAGTARARLEMLAARRVLRRPVDRIRDWERRLDELQMRAARAMQRAVQQARTEIAAQAGKLESLSPLAVLARGYCLTHSATDGTLVTDAGRLRIGERITTRYAAGSTVSRVETIDGAGP
ncbi:MAG: exodeoxyribonuclease VII large subunit [Planctomycetes bacterium]|nr:exodeoxyribonuclease VII large subunit [Planctomycetota bacterium]